MNKGRVEAFSDAIHRSNDSDVLNERGRDKLFFK